METNEKTRNSKILNIVILLIIIIVIIGIIGIAYARYIKSEKGTGEAQVAKWSFKVVDGDTSTIDVLDFPITRTDDNRDIDRSTIGPGTYGKFEIDIDARGTETIVSYGIRIGFTNKPDNLKFYSDEDMNNEIELDNDGNLIVSGFLSLEDVKYIQPHMIYWNWPFQTGTTLEEIAKNDEKDSEYIGRRLQMAITVTGVQGEEYMLANNPAAAVTINNGEPTTYMSVNKALSEANGNKGAIVTVLRNRVEEELVISNGQDVVLDLNGNRIILQKSLNIENNAKLTIQGSGELVGISESTIINDGTFIKEGTSVINNTVFTGKATLRNGVEATAILNEGKLTSSSPNIDEHYRYVVVNYGNLKVDGVSIIAKAANSRYEEAIIDGNSTTATTEIISGNIEANGSAIVHVSTKNLIIRGGNIRSTKDFTIGVNNVSDVTVSGGTITYDGDDTTKGAIVMSDVGESNLTITGGTVTANHGEIAVIHHGSTGVVTIGTAGDSGKEFPLIEGRIYRSQKRLYWFNYKYLIWKIDIC